MPKVQSGVKRLGWAIGTYGKAWPTTPMRKPPASLTVAGLNARPLAVSKAGLSLNAGFFGQEDVLRQELALEALEVGAQPLLAVGEFPMAGHRLDAEQVRGFHHVGALHGVGETAALPQIAAVEQQRIAGPDIGAQAVDQRFEMREAAEPAIAVRGFVEIEKREGVRQPALGRDAEMLEKGLADQMRRLAGHRADAEIDARLAEIDRL